MNRGAICKDGWVDECACVQPVKEGQDRSSIEALQVTNLTSNYEDADTIPGLAQCFKDLVLP